MVSTWARTISCVMKMRMGEHKGRVGKVKLWIAPDDLKAELAAIEAEAIGCPSRVRPVFYVSTLG